MKVVGKDVRENYYPRVTCDLGKVRRNTEEVMRRAKAAGIKVAAVVKGVNGLPEVAKIFEEAGAEWIATSRMEQLKALRESGIKLPFMLIRIPMLSEVPDVVQYCDVSLNMVITAFGLLLAVLSPYETRSISKAILMFPVFTFSWMPLCFMALFSGGGSWEQIRHKRAITLKDLNYGVRTAA